MNETEIISYLATNAPALLTGVGPIVGSLLTVLFLRKNTTTTEFEKIKAGKFDEALEELLSTGKITYTELYKANNFLKIAKKADEYYSQKIHTETGGCFEFDWLIRYYEAVGNISEETMQDIWAKILAGEIDTPSSYSLKTIDILRNMRKCDADLFAKLCKHSFDCNNGQLFLPNYKEYIEAVEIEYSDIMKLSEMGLLFNDSTIHLEFNLPCEPAIISANRDLVITICSQSKEGTVASISQFPFTQSGNEIATLISDIPSDEDFIRLGKEISKNRNYNVAVHRISAWENNELQYDDKNLLEI